MGSRRRWFSAIAVAGGLTWALGSPLNAQAPRPADATAQCKDGTYSKAKTERGACSGHGGVGTWYGGETKTEAKAAPKDATKATKEVGKAAESGAKAVGSATKAGAKTVAKGTKEVAKDTKAVVAGTPTDATGQCKDGTYTKAKSERGACSGHGGVAKWMNASSTTSTPTGSSGTRSAAPAPAATANPPAAATPTESSSAKVQTPPANAPPDATAQCNDGTFSKAKEHRGACSGHKGVKAWFK